MARRPTLEIDGVKYKNVHSVAFNMSTAFDDTCRPTDRAHARALTVMREMDADSPVIAQWAMDSGSSNRKGGTITIRDSDDAEMMAISWEEGFIANYICEVPHIKQRSDEQPFEQFDILARKVKIGDTEVDNLWEE
jgi:hypothetical protein